MVSGKAILCLLTSSFFAWKSSLFLSTMRSSKEIGSLFACLQPTLTYPTFFFADDVLLFTKAKKSQLRSIKDLFYRFIKALGLKINLSKSRAFYSSGIPNQKINNLTSISGIRSTTSLDKYLGFPILKGRPKRSDFYFIIEKMQTRLALWKNRLLNKPGRLALATSVLSSIPA